MCTRKSAHFSRVLAAVGIVVCATTAQAQGAGNWAQIDAGTFQMGANKGGDPLATNDEGPARNVSLVAFDIGRHEVTVRKFAEFVAAGGYDNEELWDLSAYGEVNRFGAWYEPHNWQAQLSHPNRPVTGVSWYEAMAFCRWKSVQVGRRITLPTEAQWERAARGVEGRRFAWGNKIPDGSLSLNYNKNIGHPTDVGTHPDGNTPGTNISDLAGNAWEWCLDRKVSYRIDPRAGDGLRTGRSQYRAVRGGSFHHEGPKLRAACRFGAGPQVRIDSVGFRLVRRPIAP